MKIMTDDEGSMDSMDTEEDIFSGRNRRSGSSSVRRMKNLRTLRSHSGSAQHIDRNNQSSVRRSTRNRMQTYDNLNTSWLLGTQTLKGYPMFNQHGSSSDKELADDVADRKREFKDRMPLRSRENHPLTRNSQRHMRERVEHDRPVREVRDLNRSERDIRQLRDRDSLRIKETRSKSESKIDEKEPSQMRTRQSDSPSRLREGPVTRHCNVLIEKDVKPKVDPIEPDDTSRESGKPEENNDNSDNDNDNDNGYEDMYSRVKRTRRSQRQLSRSQKIQDEDSDMSETSSEPGQRKYSLRQKKPTVDRFQANVEPVRRSIRALRSVLTNSMKRKHRSKSTSSSDSSDSEPQIYDKKKSKKSRAPAIPQGPPNRPPKADISPVTLDINTRFSDVGGLESHIQCLKEMVVFPMMYSHVFDQFHVTPPKGVLFHGPPGTGKTLIARALANECSQGSRKVTFFMRKGADCLSKWVGESERQLRLLFEQAQQMKPAIIFFDEIDGFAPVRSTKQDQIHSSIVSTLLALMDGLDDRGDVIVIGATNRIDAIDPALRRPGRFDRELFFPLPAEKERLEILKIHVSKWKNPPSEELLQLMAERTIGYCGSDLRALCTEAVIQGLRRTYPQIYMTSKRLLLDPERVEVKRQDFDQASSRLVPSSHRVAPFAGKRLQAYTIPLLGPALEDCLEIIKGIFPQGVNHSLAKIKTVHGIHRPRLLITGGKVARGQGPSLAQALIYHMEHLPVHTLDVSTLFSESARSPEETCVQVFSEAARCMPSIIYIRSIDQWWPLVPETVKAVFLFRLAAIDTPTPIMILATSESQYDDLPEQLKSLFSEFRSEVYNIKKPSDEQRTEFYKPIFLTQSLKAPVEKKETQEVLEDLPLAPDPVPKKLSDKEMKILREKEDISLRELRIFLREICAKLARNRQFFMFTKPVDIEEVPDYNTIIKQPMDLETMMTKIDMHCYMCAREFLDDIDLICRNALEYNPDRDPADKLIRHRACSLRDNAYALIKAELDSDFEDRCREISASRKPRKVASTLNRSPTLIIDDEEGLASIAAGQEVCDTPSTDLEKQTSFEKKESQNSSNNLAMNGRRTTSGKRKRGQMWARGFVKRNMKKKKIAFEDDVTSKNNSQSIELHKFEDFENSVMNGHVPDENSESENECNGEADKETKKDEVKIKEEDVTEEQKKGSEEQDNRTGQVEKEKNEASGSRRGSLDELSFAIQDGCDQENTKQVIVEREELEKALEKTVEMTSDFPIAELCDVYVQLSRCVARYAQTCDRTSLPKDLLKELEFRTSRRLETSMDRFEVTDSTMMS